MFCQIYQICQICQIYATLYCYWIFLFTVTFHCMSHDHILHCLVRCQRSLTYTVQVCEIICMLIYISSADDLASCRAGQRQQATLFITTCAVIACTVETHYKVFSRHRASLNLCLHTSKAFSRFRCGKWMHHDEIFLYIRSISQSINQLVGKCNVNVWGR